ncbi:Ground-like domain-containing protein [Aphelenchoides besseyi]|nr:Ground-like domain-containing protein [Aphelenchoides besseyi]KAI6199597.1 Ground-like domain-containing protein [Aphelenchoides besseyi]
MIRSTAVVCLLVASVVFAQDDTCYINDGGFTCCNRQLESAMKSAMGSNDLLGTADTIQGMAEGMFGNKFEVVVSADDFSSKTHFKDGKSCKIEKNGQYAAAWQPYCWAQDDTCYINDSGFTCCNRALESAMKEAMTGGDLLSSADSIQSMAETKLGSKFETIVSMDDYAFKTHFKDGKSCKIEKDGQYATAWSP